MCSNILPVSIVKKTLPVIKSGSPQSYLSSTCQFFPPNCRPIPANHAPARGPVKPMRARLLPGGRRGCRDKNLDEPDEGEKKKRKRKSFGKSRREGDPRSESVAAIQTASMTDAEAQSAPPSAPVEDKPQPERKVIGGCREASGRGGGGGGEAFKPSTLV